jgi:hypothetical protein
VVLPWVPTVRTGCVRPNFRPWCSGRSCGAGTGRELSGIWLEYERYSLGYTDLGWPAQAMAAAQLGVARRPTSAEAVDLALAGRCSSVALDPLGERPVRLGLLVFFTFGMSHETSIRTRLPSSDFCSPRCAITVQGSDTETLIRRDTRSAGASAAVSTGSAGSRVAFSTVFGEKVGPADFIALEMRRGGGGCLVSLRASAVCPR